MFRKLIISGVALGLATASSVASADHDPRDRDFRRGDEFDYARVLDVDPIVRQVRVSVPRQECWDEAAYDRGDRYDRGAEPSRAGGMILGGLIGGVLGHQIGHGRGRDAATVAGAVIGSAIGHDAASGRRVPGNAGGYRDNYRTVERCQTQYDNRVEERIDGYRVTYEYAGRQYQTRLPYDPGQRMRVHVEVVPAGR